MAMQLHTVLYELENGVATVTMNRPESLNALDAEMGAELVTALRAASADHSVRVVVLTGAGRAFCAGGDLKSMAAALTSPEQGGGLNSILRNFHILMTYLYGMDLPIIAAVHGPAIGAGMSIALSCDFRVAEENTTFSQGFIRVGLTPDGGSTWLLPRLIGVTRAKQLMMTGETLNAAQALSWGLVNEVAPAGKDLEEAREIAHSLALLSPHALKHLKRLLRSSETNSFQEQLEAEGHAQAANANTDEFRAALEAFIHRKHL